METDVRLTPDSVEVTYYEETEVVSVPSRSIFSKIVSWIVLAVTFLMPIWFLPFTSDVTELNKQVVLFVAAASALILYLIDVIRRGGANIQKSFLYWLWAAIGLVSIVGVIISVHAPTSIFGVGSNRATTLLSVISLGVLCYLVINSSISRKTILHVLMLSVTLALLAGVLNILGLSIFGGRFAERFFTPLGVINPLVFMGAISLPFFLVEQMYSSRARALFWRITRVIGAVLAVFLLVVANWIAPWIVAGIGLVALIAIRSVAGGVRSQMKSFIAPLAIIIAGAMLLLLNFAWTSIKTQLPAEVSPNQKTSYMI